ncbi:hypothetical protein evm_010534 [Chilo suppressalis]|nr:hypothetical protein evm_010534 [Chilo suppressalis]
MQLKAIILSILFCGVHCKLIELSCHDIRLFVDGHNSRRLLVAKGEVDKQPAATNMNYLVWDNELAMKAAKWASVYKHSNNPDTDVDTQRFNTGHNLYWYSTTDRIFKFSPTQALHSWFEEEHKNYRFGKIGKSLQPETGRYTQFVWADTTHVGCAVSKFHREIWAQYFVVCYYGPGGNIEGKLPYKRGKKLRTRELQCTDERCQQPYGKRCS